jgi:putative PEP-CTERM system TPR-repeat lipoprotein
VNQHAFSSDGLRRWPLLAAALAGGMAVSVTLLAPAQADVPPADAPVGPPQQASQRAIADAQKAIRSGNGRLALIILNNAVTADPHNFQVRMLLGTVLNLTGDSSGAERELRQARKDGAQPAIILPFLFDIMLARGEYQILLTQFPDPGAKPSLPEAATILEARAMALQNLNRAAEATDAIERSLALRRDTHALLIRARIALMQGRPADARTFVDEAIPKATTPEPMLFKIGLLLSARENQAALDLSNQMLAKFPGNLGGRFARVESYIALNQDDKAKAEIDDILAKNGNNPMGSFYRAVLLARAGNAKEAWSLAQNLPGEFRDAQPRVALMVADMATKAGNDETAASIMGRLLLKDPTSIPARIRLASFRLHQNNADEALKVLDPVKDSPDPQIQQLLSNAYLQLHRSSDALSVLRKLDAGGKAGPQVKRSIALLETQTGQGAQGLKDLSQLNAKDPTDLNLARSLVGALVQAKRYSEALAVADRLGAAPQQRVTAQLLRGGVLLAQKDMVGAQVAFDKAVAADPKSVDAHYVRAEYLAAAHKFADSDRDLQVILAQDPRNLGALLKLADNAMQRGHDQDVRSVLGRAIAVAPQSAAPRLTLVRYLAGRRDFKNALTAANEFARLQPGNSDAVALLGNVQLASGQKKEAVATYRHLAALVPAAAAPQVLLGNALQATGDATGAASAMETAVKRAPSVPEVRAAQINLLLSQANNDAALASARAFQSSNPGTAADILLSETLDKVKQHDQAVAVLNKSFADKPNNAVLIMLVSAALQAKDTQRAGDLMSKWLADHSDDLLVRMEYANFLMQQTDDSRAISQYETVLKQAPDNALALNNLGWLVQTSDPKRALSLLTRAVSLAPDSPDIADTQGWLKVQQKDAAGGLVLLNKAHALKPQDGEITYHLVLALDANAKRDAARGLLKALLASGAQFKDRPAAQQLSASWH